MNFKNVFPPEDVVINVPIPDVVPIETNGYCSKCESSPSNISNVWWIALVPPNDTLIILLTPVIIDVSIPTPWPYVIPELELVILKNLDSYFKLLSVPAVWPEVLKWYVPIPIAVVPNPTILDLTSTWFTDVFS